MQLSVCVCVCIYVCLYDLISIRNIDRDQCLILPFKIAARTEFQKSLPTLRVYMYACYGYICMPARVYMCDVYKYVSLCVRIPIPIPLSSNLFLFLVLALRVFFFLRVDD